MNRIDRVFGILLQFRTHRKISGARLAETFLVSERTVFRDLKALKELGIPIHCDDNGLYSLGKGYFMPPLGLDAEEAEIFSWACEIAALEGRDVYNTALSSALKKIEPSLGENAKARLKRFDCVLPNYYSITDSKEQLEKLFSFQDAIKDQEILEVTYFDGNQRSEISIHIKPQNVHFRRNSWYLRGIIFENKNWGDIEVSRIQSSKISTSPPNLDLKQIQNKPFDVIIKIYKEGLPFFDESQFEFFFGKTKTETTTDGDLLVHYQTYDLFETHGYLLYLGHIVEVIKPQPLRDRIISEIKGTLEYYKGPAS